MPHLIIVSNRLPVSIKKEAGVIKVYPSSGGLATGLSSYTKRSGTKWIGWPGLPSDNLSDTDKTEIRRQLKKYRCYPVFLSQKQIDEFYNGYSNGVLWPWFHEIPVRAGDSRKNWEAYHRVNKLFTDEVLRLSEPGCTVWVHDYQLLLVPQMLRAERAKDHIGFFLHIPFPPAKILSIHDHSLALLAGMLGADTVGFHTSSYAENFLDSCAELETGVRSNEQILLSNRTVQVTDFPMGIDYTKFASASKQRKVKTEYRRLQLKYAGMKVIVTVDRLDPTKGFIERLEAYRTVLKRGQKLRGKIIMVMLAIPSRENIAEYKKLRQKVEALVDKINREFGSGRWKPIEYMYRTLEFEQLAALYQRADVAFVAPLRDGMNLVAKEYLASQADKRGVLILSKTAGAAKELEGAIQVNPKQPLTLVRGLTRALNLPVRELEKRTEEMQRHLSIFTVQKWADSFLQSLQKPRSFKQFITWGLDAERVSEIAAAYRHAKRRLILLDYDGTLRGFEPEPMAATPTPEILRILKKLGKNKDNDVMIISGRSKQNLNEWFGDLPIALAAEHGALVRRNGGKNWHKTSSSQADWQGRVKQLFERYADMTTGAFVEEKEWSIVWHYRTAKPYKTQKSLVALRRLTKPLCKKYGLQILEGNKVFEVRPNDVSKRHAVQEWLIHDHDFTLCIGDDATDEDMFAALPPHAFSIKVGSGQTSARYRAKDVAAVVKLLGRL